MIRSIEHHVARNFELYLMGVSVALALVIPLAIEVGTNDRELAVTALAACVCQGVVYWTVRRRFRRVRREMVSELRAMLQDRINNQLTIVLMSVTQRGYRDAGNERELLQTAIAATAAVSRVLEELSMESLGRWKAKYRIDEIRPVAIPRGREAAESQTAPRIRAAAFPPGRVTAGSRTRR